jgi:hypothetical protein
MAMSFIGCDRDQVFLMPPSLREWVPEGVGFRPQPKLGLVESKL